ncbi:DUF4262 domain-containing protein [Pseudolysinimonas yzui]|uniref:DUF4262 domain-containing protein n=1 Tax=Pseudolysinimonas yzui TaxID=2708254 RepID=UPI00174957D4|nr:DUF4262 domain-containing protein [Pseudolysinimonas yzui]
MIEEHGWAVRHVMGSPNASQFSYTVGLSAFGHAEIVVTGMPFDSAHIFLNLVGQDLRDGIVVAHGIRTTRFTDSGDVAFIDAENTEGLTAVHHRYGEVRALQLIWPDSTGAYPWETGYRNPPEAQPLLGPVPDTFVEA